MSTNGLGRILEGREGKPSQLVEVLQDIQEAHGYLSENTMKIVSEKLGVPLIEVFRVANFYKAFSLVPRGRHLLTLCTGTACHVRGAPLLILEAASQLGADPGETTRDGLFTLECVNCLGACAIGSVAVLDGQVLPHMTPSKLRRLIRSIQKTEQQEASNA